MRPYDGCDLRVSTGPKVATPIASTSRPAKYSWTAARVSAGEAALYAPPNDEEAFAGLVARLLDDPDERERRGKLGRKRLEETLSWERSEEALLAGYAAALSR